MTLAAQLKAAGWGQQALLQDAHLLAQIDLSVPPYAVPSEQWGPVLGEVMDGRVSMYRARYMVRSRLRCSNQAAHYIAWAILRNAVLAGIMTHKGWKWVKV